LDFGFGGRWNGDVSVDRFFFYSLYFWVVAVNMIGPLVVVVLVVLFVLLPVFEEGQASGL
jgi:hypothetical protein